MSETLLGQVSDPVTPDWHTWLCRRGDTLVLRTHRDSTGASGERTLPLAAAAWIRDGIQEVWRSTDLTRLTTSVAGQRLELRRSWGLGGVDGRGFTLTLLDQPNAAGYPQEYAMTDELLVQGGLLDLCGLAANLTK